MEHLDAVANFFIDIARESRCDDLSPMKLLKLAYYAQGWHLSHFDGQPLFADDVEAWPYGPVVPRLYREFKDFGNESVTRKAVVLRPDNLDEYQPEVSAGSPANLLLRNIWMSYGKFNAIQLSNKTHKVGTPWERIFQRYAPKPIPRGIEIPHELMRDYFDRVRAGEIQD